MNEQPICFQQSKIPISSDIVIDNRPSPLLIDNSNANIKSVKFKSWFSNINQSRLAILCVLSCSFGTLLLLLSTLSTNDIDGKSHNFIGIASVESSNTGEKINFARVFGLIFLSPLLVIIFRIYLFLLRPFHKKLAPPDSHIDLEL